MGPSSSTGKSDNEVFVQNKASISRFEAQFCLPIFNGLLLKDNASKDYQLNIYL